MMRGRRLFAMSVTSMMVLAALSAAGSTGATAAAAAATATTPGCGTPARSGSTTLSFTIAGRSRTVIVHVPRGYRSTSAVALVLNMHGTGATALDQDEFSGMNLTANAHTFLVAYPQGFIPLGSGFEWNVPNEPLFGGTPVPAGSANDVRFLTTLVSKLEAKYCVNTNEVYAAGFSGGARMASQLACDDSSTFAAIAAVSGLRRPQPCPTSRPVPVIAFHGLSDHVDPYQGHGQAYWTYSVPAAAAQWATQDRCASTPSTNAHGGYTVTIYHHCAAGAGVSLYAITGEGHEWPGGPNMPPSITNALGPQSFALNADDLIWAFFAAHQRH